MKEILINTHDVGNWQSKPRVNNKNTWSTYKIDSFKLGLYDLQNNASLYNLPTTSDNIVVSKDASNLTDLTKNHYILSKEFPEGSEISFGNVSVIQTKCTELTPMDNDQDNITARLISGYNMTNSRINLVYKRYTDVLTKYTKNIQTSIYNTIKQNTLFPDTVIGTLSDNTFSPEINLENIIEINQLTASDIQTSDYFGRSCSLSSNGLVMVVGASGEDTAGQGAGKVYTYKRDDIDSDWVEVNQAIASDAQPNDYFGTSCSLSNDGLVMVVGADSADTDEKDTGKVYTYKRDDIDSDWVEVTQLTASNVSQGDHFGRSCSLANDGLVMVVGAACVDTSGPDTGKVYTYKRDDIDSDWVEVNQLIAGDEERYDYFGTSCSLASNGLVMVVGSALQDTAGQDAGKVYTYKRDDIDSDWVEVNQLISTIPHRTDYFGSSCSLTNDGLVMVVGAPRVDSAEQDAGKVYTYKRVDIDSDWVEVNQLISAIPHRADYFGGSCSLSGDGLVMTVGAFTEDIGSLDTGRVYTYKHSVRAVKDISSEDISGVPEFLTDDTVVAKVKLNENKSKIYFNFDNLDNSKQWSVLSGFGNTLLIDRNQVLKIPSVFMPSNINQPRFFSFFVTQVNNHQFIINFRNLNLIIDSNARLFIGKELQNPEGDMSPQLKTEDKNHFVVQINKENKVFVYLNDVLIYSIYIDSISKRRDNILVSSFGKNLNEIGQFEVYAGTYDADTMSDLINRKILPEVISIDISDNNLNAPADRFFNIPETVIESNMSPDVTLDDDNWTTLNQNASETASYKIYKEPTDLIYIADYKFKEVSATGKSFAIRATLNKNELLIQDSITYLK